MEIDVDEFTDLTRWQPEPVEIPRLGVTPEFRALMELLADRAPWPHSETFRKLATDWTTAESDEAAA